MDLELGEYSAGDVGVGVGNATHVLDAFGFDDDEAPGAVGERAGQAQAAEAVLAAKVLEVRGP